MTQEVAPFSGTGTGTGTFTGAGFEDRGRLVGAADGRMNPADACILFIEEHGLLVEGHGLFGHACASLAERRANPRSRMNPGVGRAHRSRSIGQAFREMDGRIARHSWAGYARWMAASRSFVSAVGATDARVPLVREPVGATDARVPLVREPVGATDARVPLVREPVGATDARVPLVREPVGATDARVPLIRESVGEKDVCTSPEVTREALQSIAEPGSNAARWS
jgi:hypothetical protein